MQTTNTTAFFNGHYLPLQDIRISPFDRGFLFGDSVYEVVPVYHQSALGGTEHYQRLINSLEKIGITSPYSVDEWADKMQPLFSSENAAEMLYLQVTRGVESVRKHRLPVDAEPTVFAFVMPFSPPIDEKYAGCHSHLQQDLRWQRCDIKSTSLMANIMAYQQLHENGVENDEALLVRDGHVVEAPSSNVFIVSDGVIMTPPLDNILAGVTRQMVIDDAKRLSLPIIDAPVTLATIKRADEVWVTNSYEELKPVVKIDNTPVGNGQPGEVWRTLFRAYQTRKHVESNKS